VAVIPLIPRIDNDLELLGLHNVSGHMSIHTSQVRFSVVGDCKLTFGKFDPSLYQ